MDSKYLLKIFVVFFLLLSIVVLVNSNGINFKQMILETVLVGFEGFEPQIMSGNKAFCESNTGFQQETACSKLTNYNCNLTSCCVWTSDNKCKAGTVKGPTFNSDSNGKTLPLDYYYFQNNCYGNGCP